MEASNYTNNPKKKCEIVQQAVALYRQIGQYIDRDIILDPFQGLLFYGYYADAVELIMLKAQKVTDPSQRDQVLSDVIIVLQKVSTRPAGCQIVLTSSRFGTTDRTPMLVMMQ